MAQGTREDDQSKKRKKWIETLSVLMSDDEEEYDDTITNQEEKRSTFDGSTEICLRFPYYMGSDNSDDDDDIKYFPEISPSQYGKKGVSSSSEEESEISKENHSFKHTKRKQKSDLGLKVDVGSRHKLKCSSNSDKKSQKLKSNRNKETGEKTLLNNKEKKENSKTNLKSRDDQYVKKSPVNEKNKSSRPGKKYGIRSPRTTQEYSSSLPSKSSKFLDSSLENLNVQEDNITKNKSLKFRRIRILSTSSSSDNEEYPNNSVLPQNLKRSGNVVSVDDQSKTSNNLPMNKKFSLSSSSEEEKDNDSCSKLSNTGKQGSVFKSGVNSDKTITNNSGNIGSFHSEKKPTINANAWRSIAIADIKAQFNKQSKVEDLKRKFVSSNTSSVEIYKRIQKREMCRNKSEPRRSLLKPNKNQEYSLLQHNKPTVSEEKFDYIPTTSTYQRQKQSLVDSTLRIGAKEHSDFITHKSSVDSIVPERKDSQTQNSDQSAENINLSESQLQSNFDCSLLDSEDIRTSVNGKKIRNAHIKTQKNQSEGHCADKSSQQIKPSNSSSKQLHLSNGKKPKEIKEMLDDTSKNFDVLGNIMTQMDNNRYKVQKPVNKKIEPTAEMLGWFPASSVATHLFGQTLGIIGAKPTKKDEFQLNHNSPIGIVLPTVSKATAATSSTINPSYNPLSPLSSVVSSVNDTKQTDVEIGERIHSEIKKQDVAEVSDKIQVSKIDQKSQGNASNISASKSSSGWKMVPFYSAPQEDYGGKDLGSINKITRLKESILECQTDNTNTINYERQSLDMTKSSESLLDEKNDNSVDQGMSVPTVTHDNILGKGVLSSLNKFNKSHEHIKISSSPLHSKKFNCEKNVHESTEQKEESAEMLLLPSQSTLSRGFPSGNGAICKERRSSNANGSNNSCPKGIRIRCGGTEFRLPPKVSDRVATTGFKSNRRLSDERCPETSLSGNSSSGVNSSTIGIIETEPHPGIKDTEPQRDEVLKNIPNVTEETPVKPTSSSSTSSLSSFDRSSSTDDSSSSESSDESETPSSTDGSISDNSGNRVESPILNDKNNAEESNSSLKTIDLLAKTDAQEQTLNELNDEMKILLQPTNESLNFTTTQARNSPILQNVNILPKPTQLETLNKGFSQELENNNQVDKTKSYTSVDDVIILSGSSDSESKDNAHDKEVNPQIQEDKVFQNSDLSDNRVGNVVSDDCSHTELNNFRSASEIEKNTLNANKVGKIRVKSLKELGVIGGNLKTLNALEPTQVLEVPQKQTSKKQNNQLDNPSSSNKKNIKYRKIKRRKSSSNVNKPSIIPGKVIHWGDQLVKRSTNPVTALILPIAVIKPVNVVGGVILSSVNQQNHREGQFCARSSNLSQVNEVTSTVQQVQAVTSTVSQGIPSQTICSGPTDSSNQEICHTTMSVESVPNDSEEVESLFFKLCDELFTDVVNFKIPKLVDDLHLLIAYDILKEERLMKINQLMSKETISIEKRNTEKEFAETIKIRSQSFVPLFMTIINRISRGNLKAMITALYCRIVHQLERVDPVNSSHRDKIRWFIKIMMQKHNSSVRDEILTYFDETQSTFSTNFIFIEKLLRKYDSYVEKRQAAENQNKGNVNATGMSNAVIETVFPTKGQKVHPTEKNSGDGNSSTSTLLFQAKSSTDSCETNKKSVPVPNLPFKQLPPPIGNLDQVFLKKNAKKNNMSQ